MNRGGYFVPTTEHTRTRARAAHPVTCYPSTSCGAQGRSLQQFCFQREVRPTCSARNHRWMDHHSTSSKQRIPCTKHHSTSSKQRMVVPPLWRDCHERLVHPFRLQHVLRRTVQRFNPGWNSLIISSNRFSREKLGRQSCYIWKSANKIAKSPHLLCVQIDAKKAEESLIQVVQDRHLVCECERLLCRCTLAITKSVLVFWFSFLPGKLSNSTSRLGEEQHLCVSRRQTRVQEEEREIVGAKVCSAIHRAERKKGGRERGREGGETRNVWP